jgi:cobalt transporter subunit CbtB
MSISTILSPIRSTNLSATESKTSSIVAMLLGGFIIFMIGFSHIEVVHNAAHDTRHSAAFPCH